MNASYPNVPYVIGHGPTDTQMNPGILNQAQKTKKLKFVLPYVAGALL
jgi:hypothetical protein